MSSALQLTLSEYRSWNSGVLGGRRTRPMHLCHAGGGGGQSIRLATHNCRRWQTHTAGGTECDLGRRGFVWPLGFDTSRRTPPLNSTTMCSENPNDPQDKPVGFEPNDCRLSWRSTRYKRCANCSTNVSLASGRLLFVSQERT